MTPEPRAAPGPRDALARLSLRLSGLDRVRLLSGCLVALAAITAVDVRLDPLYALSAMYLIPVLAAAARDAVSGAVVALCAAGAWFSVDVFRVGTLFDSPVVPAVNAGLRLVTFAVVVWLLSALRTRLAWEASQGRRDSLTGLANTRAFYEAAELARRSTARTTRPLTLAYIDLDDFKQVNDRLGHNTGDDVLRAVGQLLAGSVRDVDTVARLGGDEFGILMPETDAREAEVVLGRVRRRLADRAVESEAGAPGPGGALAAAAGLGFSIGAVTFGHAPDVDAMVAAADQVMYEVKRTGKNVTRLVPSP